MGEHETGRLRLYVLDCGRIHVADPSRFQLRRDELAELDLAVPAFLVVHPSGTLLWDTGAVPDAEWSPTGAPVTQHLLLADGGERDVSVVKPLGPQLAHAGHEAREIGLLALSHYHYDHTANANAFAGSTWLVRRAERDAMFAERPPGVTRPSTYAGLRDSKTLILDSDEHDVFRDGTVVIKSAPGHTPGHQVLYLKLPQTRGVLLSGDLWHYPEERTLDRVPTFEFDPAQTRATRIAIEAFLRASGTQLWIQHDLAAFRTLRKAPEFYA
jgi:glyoxylase-like metal-dependent hydrolase (beta-lactamase superfamily II)